ncbi:hypothetical protein C1H46_031418 [Malus baccata]|uniref:Uncharacterized protein n=1 Tax=Malus baccata TaxID=106549 RepID=A0A540L9V9_MALBA|nr:hypothetical protein C1H46_031418 [Malus baccata]
MASNSLECLSVVDGSSSIEDRLQRGRLPPHLEFLNKAIKDDEPSWILLLQSTRSVYIDAASRAVGSQQSM